MTGWTGGYVVEVPYTHGFYRELTPTLIRLNAVLAGVKPPPSLGFNYCELGYGQGLSSAVLAAGNPAGYFYGTDFNPDHLLNLKQNTNAAGLENVTWFDDSFGEFNERNLPDFEFVTLHGIYSWVNDEVRSEIRSFLRRRVTSGGLVYISYNCLPGWGGASGIRQILMEYAARHVASSTPIDERISQAIAFLYRMRDAGSKYMQESQDVLAHVQRLLTLDKTYIAHEFLNRSWKSFYFTELEQEMSEAKLAFVTSADVHEQFDALCFKGDGLKLMQETKSSSLRQTVHDYLQNSTFRRDIFSRGRLMLNPSERDKLLMNTRFVLAIAEVQISNTINVPAGKITLNEEFLHEIVSALAKGPQTLRALCGRKELANQSAAAILQMLCALIGANVVLPCVSEADYLPAAAVRMNKVLAEGAIAEARWLILVSPLTGSGLPVTRAQLLFVAARFRGLESVERWVRFAFDAIYPQGQRMTVDGKILETPEENIAELKSQAATFAQHVLPLLVMHGAL